MIHTTFEKIAEQHADKIAVEEEDFRITYGDLNQLANNAAVMLQKAGIEKGDIVGVMLPSGVGLVSSILSIFKSGGVYLPIDITASRSRLKQMLKQLPGNVVITNVAAMEKVVALLIEHEVFVQSLLVFDEEHQVLFYSYIEDKYIKIGNSRFFSSQNPEVQVDPEDSNYIFYTSGSTGEAKAIVGRHKSLAHFINWEIEEFNIDQSFRISQLINYTFDASLRDIFVALCAGGTLCIPSSDTKDNLSDLIDWLQNEQINLVHSVPSLLRLMMKNLQQQNNIQPIFPVLKYVLLAGEMLYAKDVHNWRNAVGNHVELINLYGPSEATLVKTFHRIGKVPEEGSSPVHVGKPIANTFIAIINNNKLCKIGEKGEIYIKTPFLTRGYLNNEALTNQVFVQNPLIKDEVDIVYKTGDFGRYLSDRSVEVLGRVDEQVKINGVRVELNEIRQAMLKVDGVREAVAVALLDKDKLSQLACYYTGIKQEGDKLRKELKKHLNVGTIPSYYIYLDEMPLNSNGKVDKKGLPSPDKISYEDEPYEAPQGQTEEALEKLYNEVLNRTRTSRNDSFFNIGGTSLKSTQLISRIYETFAVSIQVRNIFDNPTICELADVIDATPKEDYEQIAQVQQQEFYEVSHGQRRLWILNQFEEGLTAYNMPVAHRFKGTLDMAALEAAFQAVIERHEILRTRFISVEGALKQKVLATTELSFSIDYKDWRDKAQKNLLINDLVNKETNTPFDLDKVPLFRAGLVQMEEQEYVFLFNMHHIISDGWSQELLIREVLTLYHSYVTGESHALPPLRIQYKDYAAWQQEQLRGEKLKEHQNYWLSKFEHSVPVLELPTDYPRPAIKTYRGTSLNHSFGLKLTQRIKALSQAQGVSDFMVIMAAVKTLLFRYTNQKDIVVGSPTAGRSHKDLENQLGFYVNLLALRTALDGDDTFATLLEKVKETTLGAYEHEIYPFDKLVDELRLSREMSRSPIFDVAVVFQDTNVQGDFKQELEGVTVEKFTAEFKISKYDLRFNFFEGEGEILQLNIEYNTDLFKEVRIRRVINHLRQLLMAVVKSPQVRLTDIDYLTPQEKNFILYEFNDTVTPYSSHKTLHQLFEEQVAVSPQAIALKQDGNSMTYEDLNRRANQLARHLIANGVRSNDNVGIITGRNPNMIIGMLAILKANAAYVPVDPAYPMDRQQYILSNSEVKAVITDNEYPVQQLDSAFGFHKIDVDEYGTREESNLDLTKDTRELAYTIYTSGSTGRPKGVMIEHHSAVNLIEWVNKQFNVDDRDRLLFITSMCFDLSVYDIFGMLAAGGTIVIAREEEVQNVVKLQHLLKTESITFWDSVPTTLNYVVSELEAEEEEFIQNDLRVVFMSGDWIPVNLPNRIHKYFPNTEVISLGGATEGTVWSNFFPIEKVDPAWTSIPYGKPIDNNFFYILDENRQPVPQGTPGELYIGGAGVARGYANDSEKTAYSYVEDPFNKQLGGRMYRTGDLGRMMDDGNMEFLGRKDHQVKIRGFRVELGEIKNVILQHEHIKEVAVIARDYSGNRALTAYFTQHVEVDTARLNDYIAEFLPEYMIPSYFVALDQLPLNSNGKVDLKALPDPEINGTTAANYIAPVTELEKLMASIWESVLGKNKIGIKENFFSLGGDSIRAIQVASRLYKHGYAAQMRDVFSNPTIFDLAANIRKTGNVDQNPVTGKVPLTPIQHDFFASKRISHDYFNVPVMFTSKDRLERDTVLTIFNKIVEHHDVLRMSFSGKYPEIEAYSHDSGLSVSVFEADFSAENDEGAALEEHANLLHKRITLTDPPLMQIGLFHLRNEDRLMVTIHHMVIDIISWRILFEDIQTLYNQYIAHQKLQLPDKTDSYKTWAEKLAFYANGDQLLEEIPYWKSLEKVKAEILPRDMVNADNPIYEKERYKLVLEKQVSEALLSGETDTSASLHEIMLAALAESLTLTFNITRPLISLVNHGKEDIFEEINISRTVGWFSNVYPVLLNTSKEVLVTEKVRVVKEQLDGVPARGIGYNILKYLTDKSHTKELNFSLSPEVSFNYWGQFDENIEETSFSITDGAVGEKEDIAEQRPVIIDVSAMINNGQLTVFIGYSKKHYYPETIEKMADNYKNVLLEYVETVSKEKKIKAKTAGTV